MSANDLFEKYKIEINSHDFSRVEPLVSKDCKFWFSSGTFQGLEQTKKAFEKTWAMIQNEVYSITDMENRSRALECIPESSLSVGRRIYQ